MRKRITLKRQVLPYCIYCSISFGTMIRYHGKARFLYRVKEHFTPVNADGLDAEANITDACQVCNSVKGKRDFRNGVEARNYILDRYLNSDWMIINQPEKKRTLTLKELLDAYAKSKKK